MAHAFAGGRTGVRLAATVGLLALLWGISVPDQPALDLCPFHWLTGRPCPLCGLTRAVFALAKGHLSQAIQFHALSPLAFVMLFSVFWPGTLRPRLWTFGLSAIMLYGVWRAVIFQA